MSNIKHVFTNPHAFPKWYTITCMEKALVTILTQITQCRLRPAVTGGVAVEAFELPTAKNKQQCVVSTKKCSYYKKKLTLK